MHSCSLYACTCRGRACRGRVSVARSWGAAVCCRYAKSTQNRDFRKRARSVAARTHGDATDTLRQTPCEPCDVTLRHATHGFLTHTRAGHTATISTRQHSHIALRPHAASCHHPAHTDGTTHHRSQNSIAQQARDNAQRGEAGNHAAQPEQGIDRHHSVAIATLTKSSPPVHPTAEARKSTYVVPDVAGGLRSRMCETNASKLIAPTCPSPITPTGRSARRMHARRPSTGANLVLNRLLCAHCTDEAGATHESPVAFLIVTASRLYARERLAHPPIIRAECTMPDDARTASASDAVAGCDALPRLHAALHARASDAIPALRQHGVHRPVSSVLRRMACGSAVSRRTRPASTSRRRRATAHTLTAASRHSVARTWPSQQLSDKVYVRERLCCAAAGRELIVLTLRPRRRCSSRLAPERARSI